MSIEKQIKIMKNLPLRNVIFKKYQYNVVNMSVFTTCIT